jgi:hypothetical protein
LLIFVTIVQIHQLFDESKNILLLIFVAGESTLKTFIYFLLFDLLTIHLLHSLSLSP